MYTIARSAPIVSSEKRNSIKYVEKNSTLAYNTGKIIRDIIIVFLLNGMMFAMKNNAINIGVLLWKNVDKYINKNAYT
jgi:hypothetical protein